MIYRDLGQECQWQAVRLLCIVQEQNANRKNPATTRDRGKSARGNESLTKYFKKNAAFPQKGIRYLTKSSDRHLREGRSPRNLCHFILIFTLE